MVDHYTPVFDQLSEHPGLAGKVFDAVRVTNDGAAVRANYVVIMGVSPVVLDDARYTSVQDVGSTVEVAVDVRVAAVDAAGRRALVGAVTTQLVGVVLDVPGRRCDRVRWDVPVDDARFDAVARLHWQDLGFLFVSRRT
jgi:hypothetical protein